MKWVVSVGVAVLVCECFVLLWLWAVSYWLLAVSRLEDEELNSRGFSNPWNTSWFNYRTVCKDGGFQYRGTFKSSGTLPFRVFTDAISSSLLFPRT